MITPGRQKRLVSVGEAMVELAPSATPGQFGIGFAGDTLNTAWYARRTLPRDWAVDYLTGVGTDAISDRMVGFLAGAGLGVDHLVRVPGRTVGLYLIELQDGERSFSYWRGQSAARLLAQDAGALSAAFAGAGVIYLSGITLAVLEGAGRAHLFAELAAARAQGGLVVFDPNLRPRLWPDTATMCAVVMQAAALADIVLPSHEDEASFFGDADPLATARRYAAAGAGLVVVKNGGGDMVSLHGEQVAPHSPVAVTRIVDTTAAGDSFNAGFLAEWLVSGDLAAAVGAGARLAGKVIGARGALCDV